MVTSRGAAFAALVLLGALAQAAASGQAQTAAGQSPLFFREDWNGRKTPGFLPMNQGDVGNPNLLLQLYGPGALGQNRNAENTLNITVRRPAPKGGPDEALDFIWSGMSEGNWAALLKHKDSYVDLSRPGARIRWRSWQDGAFQVLRPVLKLADETYVVGMQGSGTTEDYVTTELMIASERWVTLDAELVLDRGNPGSVLGYTKPDLSRVDEVGVTTLSRGGGHGAAGVAAHVDWIEVYGFPVPRSVK